MDADHLELLGTSIDWGGNLAAIDRIKATELVASSPTILHSSTICTSITDPEKKNTHTIYMHACARSLAAEDTNWRAFHDT